MTKYKGKCKITKVPTQWKSLLEVGEVVKVYTKPSFNLRVGRITETLLETSDGRVYSNTYLSNLYPIELGDYLEKIDW